MKFTSRRSVPILCALLMMAALFYSCRQPDLFERNTNIPGMKWQSNFNVTGTFNITDTASQYNIYIVLRHTDAYRYNNIWLSAGLQIPGDTIRFSKVNLELGNDAEGWEGSGMSDIWEVRKLVSKGPQFLKQGEYKFSISQIMRDDPLENVMSAGIRIEKASVNNDAAGEK